MALASLTSSMLPSDRIKWRERYRKSKKYGIIIAFSEITTVRVLSLIKKAAKDRIKAHAKKNLGSSPGQWGV